MSDESLRWLIKSHLTFIWSGVTLTLHKLDLLKCFFSPQIKPNIRKLKKLIKFQNFNYLSFSKFSHTSHQIQCKWMENVTKSQWLTVMWELRSSEVKQTFIPALGLLAMCSIYIGQLLRPAAPLIMGMHVRLGGVVIMCEYPHPAVKRITKFLFFHSWL